MVSFKKMCAINLAAFLTPAIHALCPDTMSYNSVTKLCSDSADAAGPFTKQMTDLCVKYGAGSSCTSSSTFKVNGVDVAMQRWNKSFAANLRGNGACPFGSFASATYDNFCLENISASINNLYGNFSQALANKCAALNGGLACLSNRWSPSWYAYVRDAPAPFMWSKASDLNVNLPTGIEIFRGSGDGLQAYYAKLNPSANPNLDWSVVSYLSGSGRTPTQFASNATRKAYVTINAGFFDPSAAKQSLSLVLENGNLLSAGATQLNRNSQTYYPTRAAFGADATGAITLTWPYVTNNGTILRSYLQPSPNDASKPPQAQPSASFPAGAQVWTPIKAIGGGPMLLKNGNKIKQEVAEMIDDGSGINPYGAGPRTSVAKLSDGSLVFMVVDGRSVVSRGVNLEELRDMLLNINATDALSLDGGGVEHDGHQRTGCQQT